MNPHFCGDDLDKWEIEKLKEWQERGVLTPDGRLRVGRKFEKKAKGRPRRALTAVEIMCLMRERYTRNYEEHKIRKRMKYLKRMVFG